MPGIGRAPLFFSRALDSLHGICLHQAGDCALSLSFLSSEVSPITTCPPQVQKQWSRQGLILLHRERSLLAYVWSLAGACCPPCRVASLGPNPGSEQASVLFSVRFMPLSTAAKARQEERHGAQSRERLTRNLPAWRQTGCWSEECY